jgi:hypothetical protein
MSEREDLAFTSGADTADQTEFLQRHLAPVAPAAAVA